MATDSRHMWRVALSALALTVYAAAGLSPLRFEGLPRIVKNGATSTAEGGFRFSSPGMAKTRRPPEWLQKVIAGSSLEVQIEARAARDRQCGSARIFSISKNTSLRNLTIAQEGSDLVVLMRTPETSPNGGAAHKVPGVFADTEVHTIFVTLRDGSLRISVDGAEAREDVVPPHTARTWDPRYRVFLGNEGGGQRPWLGEIRRATVRAGEDVSEYAPSEDLVVGRYYLTFGGGVSCPPLNSSDRALQESDSRRWQMRDRVINVLGFVPLGCLLALLWPTLSVPWLGMVCGTLSVLIETGQLFVPGHHPQIVDLLLNIAGGTIGAVLGKTARSWALAARMRRIE